MKKIILIATAVIATSCSQKVVNTTNAVTKNNVMKTYDFELQGHRGARGLAPENTIAAFKKALELNVNTLELDVVVTKDKQLIVSHEPWLNAKITLDKSGKQVGEQDALAYNIYQHDAADLQTYDVGSLGNTLFPEQKKEKISKPLLSTVFKMAEKANPTILYNIEIKSTIEDEEKGFQPNVGEFSDLLVREIEQNVPKERVVIQSFDIRVLQYIHSKYPEFTLSYLTFENNFEKNIELLGFTPAIYSPYYVLLNADEVKTIHNKNVKVIPWTVNTAPEMQELLAMGVDGLISDYPNLALPFRKK
jgi:glycerophosphoryl diester phosphodiesterase